MATADQIKALVRSHCDGDNERFKAIVLQIAAHDEARSPANAKALRTMLERAPQTFVQVGGSASHLVEQVPVGTKLTDLVIADDLRTQLQRAIDEQRAADRLFVHGLAPASKLLFVGPPGVGKTMAAGVLAVELGIPLRKVNLHALFNSHLGETAKELQSLFAQLHTFRGVYLFDEFDALGSSRHREHDVGEMRRVVNSVLMMMMDQPLATSVLVATTNYSDALDPAVFRRFDAVLDFGLADGHGRHDLIRRTALWLDGLDLEVLCAAAQGMSHHDIVQTINAANKDAVLADRVTLDQDRVMAYFASRLEDR